MEEFTVSTEGSRVEVAGEVDLETSVAFREALRCASSSGSDELVVDLTKVTFMDSSGLNEIVRIAGDHSRVVVVGASAGVKRLLELTGVDTVVQLS